MIMGEISKGKITLADTIEWCKKILNTPEGKRNKEEVEGWLTKLNIKSYLPLMEKAGIVNKILFLKTMPDYNSEIMNIVELEKIKFWEILLAYTDIDMDESENLKTVENYDILYFAIGDYIYARCYNDYNRIIKMIDDYTNYSNIQTMLEGFNEIRDFDYGNIEKSLEDTIDRLGDLQDKIEDIRTDNVTTNAFDV